MSLRTLEKAVNRTADRTVGDIVATYGSNVQRLKMDAAAGKIDPTTALMAMMTIQRIVAANTQPPSGTTVAQDTGMAPPPQQMGMSAMAPQQPPTRMAYGGQVAVSNNQVPSPAMERGLDGIPIPDNMFDYAGGGMVAFAGGGDVQRFQTGSVGPVQANPPFSPFGASTGKDYLSLLRSLIQTQSYQDIEDILKKMPTNDPKYAVTQEAAKMARSASDAATEAARQNILKEAATFADRFKPTLEDQYSSFKKAVPGVLKGVGTGLGMGALGVGVEALTGVNPTDITQTSERGIGMMPGITNLASRLAKRIIPDRPAIPSGDYINVGIPNVDKLPPSTEGQPSAGGKPPEAEPAAPAQRPPLSAAIPEVNIPAPVRPADRSGEYRSLLQKVTQAPDLDALINQVQGDTKLQGTLNKMFQLPEGASETEKEAIQKIKDFHKANGYDFGVYADAVSKVRSDVEKIPEQRKEAGNLRLIEAGLSIMGGTSPFAFANFGLAKDSIKGFGEDLKDLRKLERELRREETQLRSMQNQESFMFTKAGMDRYEKTQDKVAAIKQSKARAELGIAEKMFDTANNNMRSDKEINSRIMTQMINQQGNIDVAMLQATNQANIANAQLKQQGALAGYTERLKQDRENQLVDQIMADAQAKGTPITRSEAYRIFKEYDTGLGGFRAQQNAIAEQRIRAQAASKIDEQSLRNQVAKGMGLNQTPPKGANTAFDNRVNDEYEKMIQRALKAQPSTMGASTGVPSGYRLLGPE